MASPVTFAVTFALREQSHLPWSTALLVHSQTAEGDLFTRIEKGTFKFTAGFCCEISKVLMGGMRGHLNIQQAEKSVRTTRRERLGVFPGDFMNDVKENEAEHVFE